MHATRNRTWEIKARGRTWDMSVVLLSVVTLGAAMVFWNAPLLLPIKLFVVLLHEISHGLAAVLTGGSVERLVLLQDEGGLAFTRGGSRFLTLSAGYLGSAAWGALLLRLAWARPQARKLALQAIGAALGLVTLLYARDLFTIFYLVLATVVTIAVGWRAGGRAQMAILWLLGSFSCLYAVIDIGTDIVLAGPLAGVPFIGGPARLNDAEMLADVTFIPAFVWGVLWSAAAIAVYGSSVAALAGRRKR